MWLGLISLFIFPAFGIFGAVIMPLLDPVRAGEDKRIFMPLGFLVPIITLSFTIFSLKTGIKAYKMGERSYVLWIGFVPAILVTLFWVFMIIGEFIFSH